MSKQMDADLIKLTDYVNKAADMAESLQADIKTGDSISMKTVLALAKFVKAADRASKMLEIFKDVNEQLN